jgi:two-component system OmpR family response regulator
LAGETARASASRYIPSRGAARLSRRIAIVEDDPGLRANYADVLRRQGYDVATHADRAAAMLAFRTRLPDLAILDIGLGDEIDGGFALCRELRGLSATVPIIFLTARDSEFDTVSGLRLGADDYLTKDASLPHLLARIAALFRRVDAPGSETQDEEVIERGPLRAGTAAASTSRSPSSGSCTRSPAIPATSRTASS